jgi:hypothetical protein
MQLISSVSVGSGGSTLVSFTSIPQTFTDLVLLSSARCSVELTGINIAYNSSGSTDYFRYTLQGDGSTAAVAQNGPSTTMLNTSVVNKSDATASVFSNTEIYIPNYTGSTAKILVANGVTENNSTQAFQVVSSGFRTATDAITSIQLTVQSPHSFVQYSKFYLYGILKGSGGATVS